MKGSSWRCGGDDGLDVGVSVLWRNGDGGDDGGDLIGDPVVPDSRDSSPILTTAVSLTLLPSLKFLLSRFLTNIFLSSVEIPLMFLTPGLASGGTDRLQ